MSHVQEIRIHLDGVSNVLKTKRFRVPAYQRSYAWEQEHVNDLLQDIREAIGSKESEYFLGSIVVTGPIDGKHEVVDGQQRLTTISLLVAAIKDIFAAKNDHEVVVSVKGDYLANTDRKTKEKEPKLTLNEVDNELFQELIENAYSVDRSKFQRQSHQRLINAYSQIQSFLKTVLTESKDEEETLHAWLDYLESNLKIIVVAAPDDSNAFVIFETLNDRGLELAISDLLKNYIFHKSGDKLEEAKNRWLSMIAVLEATSEEPLTVTYLRHFAMSRYGLVRERDLFSTIKKKVANKKSALQLATDLNNTVKVYSALVNTDHELWQRYDKQVSGRAATLNLLNMSQIRPLLIAILEKFGDSAVSESFRLLESAAVRFQIVGGVGGGTLEKIYSDTAKAVFDGGIKTPKDLLAAFTTLPTDAAFRQAFTVAQISRQNLARYYLMRLESALSGGSVQELVPNPNTGHINLEHVLPLTLSESWQSSWKLDLARGYQKRLANLALLNSKENSKTGNDDFSKKVEAYAKSSIALTKRISEFTEWTPDTIETRQKQMAELAVKAWPIK
ncbi:DUF262 domain-containing protein [Solilutibacter tolerans]|uniref:DUF262 domain-containing protein n=1 Tax=Solilutibacter tolerans TaxID=1604334 RepID=A0A1N6YJ54_9GAMM|nr:DUF262 domain-containing protein [Lysobacter tolerans]SIR14602.1 Protein of unknown function [Lysobacter tolerans]